MAVTLAVVSVLVFAIIQLPPGDFLTTYIAQLEAMDQEVTDAEVAALKVRYGLEKPIYQQYLKWITGILLRGDFGYSFQWNKPVHELIGERLLLTMVISLTTLVFTYVVAIAIGIYSAIRQYSFGDYLATFVGFIGLATPNFLLALVLMFLALRYFGISAGGLFSPEFVRAPWSGAKVLDLLQHLWVPVIVVGTAGTAGLIRIMRGVLLDELHKQYVVTARAKGNRERRLVFKYPVRVAINPVVSTVGWVLPEIISGATITAVVLSLPTTGPLLLKALLSQDMFLAGSFLLVLAALTVVGTLISDLMLAAIDPRIRLERGA